VDSYIDLKLGRFPLNEYQQNQMIVAKNKFIEGYMKINENSFKSKELLKQHNDETEESLSLELDSLLIKKYLVKNENGLCFTGKEKEGIQKLSKKIQFEMDSYTKEPISIFSSDKEVTYNPNTDKLTHYIKMKDEMVAVPDIGSTQAYSDDDSTKAEKLSERMHNFIINRTVLEPKSPAPSIKGKMKYSREIEEDEEDNEFQFSDEECVLVDNEQQLNSMKRNKKDDHDKDPDGMDPAGNSSVTETSISTSANSNKSKASQKDKQPNNDNNNNKKKKGNIFTINIINISRLLICCSMIHALQEATTFKDGNIMVHSFLDTAL
jgi:hypothetical protein